MLSPGALLSDRYRLDARVATGGMGDVWRATDVLLGREVAVKILLPSLLTDPTFIARFRGEARMMAALRHPGVVQVYDVGEDTLDDGSRADYLVMEYVDGEPLARRVDETGPLPAAEALSVIAQAADALHAAHEAGIVHRDVKPSNLLVQPNGNVVLVDFGVARSTNVTSVTSADAVPGTVLYMAPEQAAGRPVSAATDIYALGAVAYCCVAGHPPFAGDNPLEVAIKHIHEEPPPLPDDIPPAAREVIERALAKEPEDRYPSAAAFAAAARAARAASTGETTPAVTPGPVAAAAGAAAVRAAGPSASSGGTLTDVPVAAGRPARRRNRAAAGLTAALGALAVVGTLVALLGFRDDGRPEPNTPDPSASVSAPPASEQPAAGGANPSGGHGSGTPRRSTPPPANTPSHPAATSAGPTATRTEEASPPAGGEPTPPTTTRSQSAPTGAPDGSPVAG